MATIMSVALLAFGSCIAAVGLIFLRNRVLFRVGLRNIPRRGAQTVLILVGLMLSTLIITAALTTGDTVDRSITSTAFQLLQRADLGINLRDAGEADEEGRRAYPDERLVSRLELHFADDPDIEVFLPYLFEDVPAVNPRTRLSEPEVNLVGVDPERQARVGGLRDLQGQFVDLRNLAPDEAVVSEAAARKLDALPGDVLTIYAQDEPHDLRVAAIVRNEAATGVFAFGFGQDGGGIAVPLSTAQRIVGRISQISWLSVALRGDPRDTSDNDEAAAKRLQDYLRTDEGRAALGTTHLDIRVERIKQQTVETAERFGNVFTTFFLVLGLFSMAAGVLLIFMIFVMLAAERRTEMGIARAVGARRVHLLQMFIAEGMAYALLAGAAGLVLGVGTSVALVKGGTKLIAGDELSFFEVAVSPRSLIIAYCLGVVVTFVTVTISALRISHINIVAAIRDMEDHPAGAGERRHRSLRWALAALPAFVLPPLGAWLLVRRGLGRSRSEAWGALWLACAGLLLGAGAATDRLIPFLLGLSLIPLAGAPLLRTAGVSSRATWSLVGLLVALTWLVPVRFDELLLGRELASSAEMFLVSALMVTTAFTLLVVFNIRTVLTPFQRRSRGELGRRMAVLTAAIAVAVGLGFSLRQTADGIGQLLYLVAFVLTVLGGLLAAAATSKRISPAFTTAAAYPMASRFRTGMTVAMFSLVVFSLVAMSVINANFGAAFASDEATAGYDVVLFPNRNNDLGDPLQALEDTGFDTSVIASAAGTTGRGGTREVRQEGTQEWIPSPVRGVTDSFWSGAELKLEKRANGYASDAAVFEAARTNPSLGIIDFDAVGTRGLALANPDFKVRGIDPQSETFEPFDVELRDPISGRLGKVTIIGVISSSIRGTLLNGIYMNRTGWQSVFGEPYFARWYLRLNDGADASAIAKQIRAALLTKGVQADSVIQRVQDEQALGRGLSRVFQAFMALGLVVGIAGLGVIAFRSVVERRHQIGMLRAIGFQRSQIAASFLLESGFVAMAGILSGVVGAVIVARRFFVEGNLGEDAARSFYVPWFEVGFVAALAMFFALLMTWWPSRAAARIPVAEAMRYE